MTNPERPDVRDVIQEALHNTLPKMAKLESGLANVTSGRIADAILVSLAEAGLAVVPADRLERLRSTLRAIDDVLMDQGPDGDTEIAARVIGGLRPGDLDAKGVK